MLESWPKAHLPGPESRASAYYAFMASVPYFMFVAALFVFLITSFHFEAELNEGDLYRVVLGLLNGKATGLELNDPMQYGIRFGYGYVAMVYWLGELHIFAITHRESLIEAMNAIGFVASLAIVGFLMASLQIMYGAPTALFASTIFLFSPLFMEMATSGHQLLIALAFFFAANLVLLLDVRGWWKILSYGTASLLLFVGLTMRAELPLAFPWLVFAGRPTELSSRRLYIPNVVARSVVCLIAFAIFQTVFHSYIDTPPTGSMSGLSTFMGQFYNLRNVMRGFVICVVGIGLATVVTGGAVLLIERTRIIRDFRLPDFVTSGSNLIGPLALIFIGAAFWIPNPNPARHFTFFLLGLAVLIALSITRRFRLNRVGAIAAGLAIVIANQALAEVVRPIVLRNLQTVYIRFPERNPTTGAVPLGSFPRHHASLAERAEILTNFARMVTGSCEPRLLVLTSNGPLMAGLMFKPQFDSRVGREKVGSHDAFKNAFTIVRQGQTFLFVDPLEIWPQDPVSVILKDTSLAGYQLLRDPYSISTYDKLAIPASRMANYPQLRSEMRCDGQNEQTN
jgi:hypothetical protein